MIYLDTLNVRIEWDAADRWMMTTWLGYVELADYRAALNKLLDGIVAHGATRMLHDMRKAAVVTAADQAWLNTEWMPRLFKTRLRYSAVVLAQSAIAQMSVDRIVRRAPLRENEIESMNFDNIEKARAWLRSHATPSP